MTPSWEIRKRSSSALRGRTGHAGNDATGGGKAITFKFRALAKKACASCHPLIACERPRYQISSTGHKRTVAIYSGMFRRNTGRTGNCIFGDYQFLISPPKDWIQEIFNNQTSFHEGEHDHRGREPLLLQMEVTISDPGYLKIAGYPRLLPGILYLLDSHCTPEVVKTSKRG